MTAARHLTAPPRHDLPWLRRRTLRTAETPAPAASRPPVTGPAASGPPVTRPATSAPTASTPLDLGPPDAVRPAAPPVTRHAPPSPAVPAPPAGGSTSLDLGTPGRPAGTPPPSGSTSLDLTPTPVPAAPASRSTSLDLTPVPAPAAPASPSRSLDLSPSGAGARAEPPGRARPPRPSAANGDPVLGYVPRRVSRDRPTSLTRSDPTVALTRVQSGVGALTVRAVVPAAVGDLRLAVAYTLHSGESSVLAAARGLPVAPPGSRRPVVSGSWEGQETLRVDLRQVTLVDRLVVLAFSQSGGPVAWGGALVVESFGGARVDVPLDHPPAAGVLVALSVSAVDGELVLRAEDELLVGGTLRDAAAAYGFDRITWVDPWTPLG